MVGERQEATPYRHSQFFMNQPTTDPEDNDPLSRHWRPQCLVARIQRDAAIAVIAAIEERFTDGCDTYDDWQFMGSTARDFLDSIRGH